MTAKGQRGTTRAGSSGDPRPVEQRAEELMARWSSDASKFLTRFVGRAREEFEDVVAEARTLTEDWERDRSRQGSNSGD
jgi:hypothetical protein